MARRLIELNLHVVLGGQWQFGFKLFWGDKEVVFLVFTRPRLCRVDTISGVSDEFKPLGVVYGGYLGRSEKKAR